MLLSHNNSFTFKAVRVIGDVHQCSPMFKLLFDVHQCSPVFFLLNIVYFSVCLTSNKLYWIEDQLTDVSTRFYTSASWCRRVGVGELTGYLLIYIALVSSIYCRILNNSWRVTLIILDKTI